MTHARSICPDCHQQHAIPALPGGRCVARCSHCRRLWPPGVAGETTAGRERCADHPGRRARRVCERCDKAWCEPCTRRARAPGFQTALSPCCREGLVPIAEIETTRPFWTELPSVLVYALRGGSPFVLLFLFLGGFVPVLAWTIPVFAAAYGVHVTRRSANDPYSAPDFPEPDDILVDFLFPLFRLLGASAIAFSPWLLYLQFGPETPDPYVQTFVLVVGLSVYPVIVLNSTIRNRLFEALAPADLARTMRSMGPDYLALVVAFGAFVLAWKMTGRIADINDGLALLMRFARFYLLVTIFHVLGRAVWQTRDRIDWGV